MNDTTSSRSHPSVRDLDLLTITEAAELVPRPGRHPALLAPPRDWPEQLPPRPPRRLQPGRSPSVDRRPAQAERPGSTLMERTVYEAAFGAEIPFTLEAEAPHRSGLRMARVRHPCRADPVPRMRLMGNHTPSEVLPGTLRDSEVAFDREGVGAADRFRRSECDAAGSVDVRRSRGGWRSLGDAAIAPRIVFGVAANVRERAAVTRRMQGMPWLNSPA